MPVNTQVYELASRNQPADRNEVISQWRKTGGVLVMGYQLFRRLVSYSGKSRKTKQLYDSALVNPGNWICATFRRVHIDKKCKLRLFYSVIYIYNYTAFSLI